jgi:ADP-ribose pyrophosphatase YjhB (NUDIX family)
MSIWTTAKGIVGMFCEAARHLRRRPATTVAVAARTKQGRCLLVRRGDEGGEWTLPGGGLRWGETLRECASRHVREAAGVSDCEIVRTVGVDSRPEPGRPLHSVTVVIDCRVDDAGRPPTYLQDRVEVRFFEPADVSQLPARTRDLLDAAFGHDAAFVE